jgi:hypothetical protein
MGRENVPRSAPTDIPKIQEVEPERFFIIYKTDTAEDLARHVHEGLHNRGVDVFLATKDLREGLTQSEWKAQRDLAIGEAQVFIFIVTHSASTSDEVRHELKVAIERGKDIRAFVDSRIWDANEQLRFPLNGDTVDIKSFQIRRFDTKPEALLREVIDSTLSTRIVRPAHEEKQRNDVSRRKEWILDLIRKRRKGGISWV